MGAYCLVTFFSASILFGVKHLLLRDATFSRLSKAADYVPAVEVCPNLLHRVINLCSWIYNRILSVCPAWTAG